MQHLTSFSVLRSTQVKVVLAIQVSTFRPLLYSNTTIILSLHPEPNLSLSSHRCGQWVSHPVSHLVKSFHSSSPSIFILCYAYFVSASLDRILYIMNLLKFKFSLERRMKADYIYNRTMLKLIEATVQSTTSQQELLSN